MAYFEDLPAEIIRHVIHVLLEPETIYSTIAPEHGITPLNSDWLQQYTARKNQISDIEWQMTGRVDAHMLSYTNTRIFDIVHEMLGEPQYMWYGQLRSTYTHELFARDANLYKKIQDLNTKVLVFRAVKDIKDLVARSAASTEITQSMTEREYQEAWQNRLKCEMKQLEHSRSKGWHLGMGTIVLLIAMTWWSY